MKRTRLNLVVDLAAIVLLLGMIATGFILWFPLPPGTETTRTLWGLTRYSWGHVHAWISLALLAVLLVHVALHWKWLVSVVGRRLGHEKMSARQTAVAGLITAVVLLIFASLFALLTFLNVRPLTESQRPGLPVTPGNAGSATTQNTVENPQSETGDEQTPPDTDLATDTIAAVSWSTDVWPILQRRCLRCHGPDRAAGNFRVDREEDFYGGDGGPLIMRGRSDASGLIDIVTGARRLPRPGSHRLAEDAVEVLKNWIDAGAPRVP